MNGNYPVSKNNTEIPHRMLPKRITTKANDGKNF